MYFIGDVHGLWVTYWNLIKTLQAESIQLGDFGMGFRPSPAPWDLSHRFIPGNHDKPEDCKVHPNCLGYWGVTETNIFYIGGGLSIDRQYRTIGVDWWLDEEIPMSQYEKVATLYERTKPRIVCSHDCPRVVKEQIGSKLEWKSRTSDILMPALLEVHKPEVWVFGHHHESIRIQIDGVRYIGLAELETVEVE